MKAPALPSRRRIEFPQRLQERALQESPVGQHHEPVGPREGSLREVEEILAEQGLAAGEVEPRGPHRLRAPEDFEEDLRRETPSGPGPRLHEAVGAGEVAVVVGVEPELLQPGGEQLPAAGIWRPVEVFVARVCSRSPPTPPAGCVGHEAPAGGAREHRAHLLACHSGVEAPLPRVEGGDFLGRPSSIHHLENPRPPPVGPQPVGARGVHGEEGISPFDEMAAAKVEGLVRFHHPENRNVYAIKNIGVVMCPRKDADGPALRRKYDRISRFYDLLDLWWEVRKYRRWRAMIFASLCDAESILDLGAGTGTNIPHYPVGPRAVALDQSRSMLRRALSRREQAGGHCAVIQGSAYALPFPEGSFDAVVATFLFCVLPDADRGLREVARVLRPGGTAWLIEYELSRRLLPRLIMRFWTPWVRWLYGASFTRNVAARVPGSGLEIAEERWLSGDFVKLLVLRKPGPDYNVVRGVGVGVEDVLPVVLGHQGPRVHLAVGRGHRWAPGPPVRRLEEPGAGLGKAPPLAAQAPMSPADVNYVGDSNRFRRIRSASRRSLPSPRLSAWRTDRSTGERMRSHTRSARASTSADRESPSSPSRRSARSVSRARMASTALSTSLASCRDAATIRATTAGGEKGVTVVTYVDYGRNSFGVPPTLERRWARPPPACW